MTIRSQKSAATRKRIQDKQRADEREASAAKRAAGITYATDRLRREDIEARLAEIPADTRGLTAKVFGDPLPGRSALDRRTA